MISKLYNKLNKISTFTIVSNRCLAILNAERRIDERLSYQNQDKLREKISKLKETTALVEGIVYYEKVRGIPNADRLRIYSRKKQVASRTIMRLELELQCQLYEKELSDLLQKNRVLVQNLGKAKDLLEKMETEREESAPPRYENVFHNKGKIDNPATMGDGIGQVPDQGGRRKAGKKNWFRKLFNRLR